MKHLALWLLFLPLWPGLAAQPSGKNPIWEHIYYPSVPAPWKPKSDLFLLVGRGGELGEESHLRVDICCSGSPEEIAQMKLPDPKEITVRLHKPDGTTVSPQHDFQPAWVGAASASVTESLMYFFSWGANDLAEGWIEMRLPGKTYRLEVPYGFTRDPQAPLPPTGSQKGEPSLAPAMKAMEKSAEIVPWKSVDYDLGDIQNGWRLSLKMSNPGDGECELTLYREPQPDDKNWTGWDLHNPRTSISIKEADSSRLESQGTDIHRHEDGMRRSDFFKFNRDPEDGRSWGTLTVTVDDRPWAIAVPSSMYRFGHGHAEGAASSGP